MLQEQEGNSFQIGPSPLLDPSLPNGIRLMFSHSESLSFCPISLESKTQKGPTVNPQSNSLSHTNSEKCSES